MTARNAGLLGGTRTRPPRPPWPDQTRWMLSLLGTVIVAVGFWGEGALLWLVRLHPWSEYQLMLHRTAWDQAWSSLWYAAVAVLVAIGMEAAWCVAVALRWRWWFRAVEGQYLELVMPRPAGSAGVRATLPQASAVFWDRLVATLQDVDRGGVPPYVSSELWGDASGRVRWGIWLPTHVAAQREPIRRLVTAQRADARLADAADPLVTALAVAADEGRDSGACWYATAQLILHAPDYLPLGDDAQALRTIVAALRPARRVMRSGVSMIVMPAPKRWTQRANAIVQRRHWNSRYQCPLDVRYRTETDLISVKVQQAHAYVVLRVHVVATSADAARAECAALATTLTAGRQRYAFVEQRWRRGRIVVHAVRAATMPPSVRAPFRPMPRLCGLFPLL